MEIFGAFGAAAPVLRAVLLTALAVAWTLLLARIVGLRAFSKATAFDFAATIATGSLIAQAGTRSSWSEYVQAMSAIGAIFLVQYVLARGRTRSSRFADAMDNTPILLMEDVRFLSPDHGTREIKDAMSREILAGLEARGMGLASATFEFTGLPVLTVEPKARA